MVFIDNRGSGPSLSQTKASKFGSTSETLVPTLMRMDRCSLLIVCARNMEMRSRSRQLFSRTARPQSEHDLAEIARVLDLPLEEHAVALASERLEDEQLLEASISKVKNQARLQERGI